MKLRVVLGACNPQEYPQENGVRTLHQGTALLIQGDQAVRLMSFPDGRKVCVAGNIIGWRGEHDAMEPLAIGSEALQRVLATHSLDVCRDRLEGRFVLVNVGADGSCTLCADRFSQQDLFYRASRGITEVVSDLTLLSRSPSETGFDQAALVHLLTVYGYRPPKGRTMYNDVLRLRVGESMHAKPNQTVTMTTTPFQPRPAGNYGEQDLNRYAELFIDAVRMRGSKHGNVVYLSSGWDSTSILAALVHVFGKEKVRAVIGRMRYSERSGVINPFELERAKGVADFYGVTLDTVDFDFRQQIPSVWESLRPALRANNIASLNCFSHGILADYVAKTTTGDESVFAGEISDGAHNLGFSQYVSIFHPVQDFREYSDKMASYLFGPTFHHIFQAGKHMDDPIYKLFRDRAGNAQFDAPSGDAVGRSKQLLAGLLLRMNRVPLWSMRNNQLLTAQGVSMYGESIETPYLEQAARSVAQDPSTIYSWYLHLYNSFHWQGSTVATLPMTADVNGIRVELPFWDSRLQEFLSAMPEHWGRGLDLNPTKYPLKWMLKHRIKYPNHLQVGPHSYLYDVDHSFNHAAETIYASAFTPYFKKVLRQREYRDLLSSQYFNVPYIDGLVDRYLDGVETRGAELNDLFSICMVAMVGWL